LPLTKLSTIQVGPEVDSLLVVDLRRTDPRLLKRFLGSRGYDEYLNYHSLQARYKTPTLQGAQQWQ
jgi:hypothetical protein